MRPKTTSSAMTTASTRTTGSTHRPRRGPVLVRRGNGPGRGNGRGNVTASTYLLRASVLFNVNLARQVPEVAGGGERWTVARHGGAARPEEYGDGGAARRRRVPQAR